MSNTLTTERAAVISPFTPLVPNENTIRFAASVLRNFGEFVLVNTKGEKIATEETNAQVFDLFKRVLVSVAEGKAVSVIPHDTELTTYQTANLLNISRPYLIKLLEKNEIGFHMVGTHRRIYFKDAMKYKSEQKEKSHKALNKLSALSQKYGLD